VKTTRIPENKRSAQCRGHVARVLSGGKWRVPAQPVQCVNSTRNLYDGVPYCGAHKRQAGK
jgi:hypothetical protein